MDLEETWEKCLKIWRWIYRHHKDGLSGYGMKLMYTKKHPEIRNMYNQCYFCAYAGEGNESCKKCPGRLVDPSFDCFHSDYSFDTKPKTFYLKLLSLNRKRKKLKCKQN